MHRYKQQINMFSSIHGANRVKLINSKKLVITVFGSLVLINLLTFGIAYGNHLMNEKKISELQHYLVQPKVLKEIEQEKNLATKVFMQKKDLNTLKKLNQIVDGVIGFETSIYYEINAVKPQAVTIHSFSYYDNTVQVDCTTTNDNPPADYTKALEKTGMFQSVTYKGFSTSDNGIVFPIICELKVE